MIFLSRCRTQPCGHYTQLIAARTKYVGCGKAYCEAPYDPDTGKIIIRVHVEEAGMTAYLFMLKVLKRLYCKNAT